MLATVLLVLFVVLVALFVALGAICVVQSFTGRQFVRPDLSTRPPAQVKRESRWSAGEYLAIAAGMVALAAGQPLLGFVLGLAGIGCYVGLALGRRAAR